MASRENRIAQKEAKLREVPPEITAFLEAINQEKAAKTALFRQITLYKTFTELTFQHLFLRDAYMLQVLEALAEKAVEFYNSAAYISEEDRGFLLEVEKYMATPKTQTSLYNLADAAIRHYPSAAANDQTNISNNTLYKTIQANIDMAQKKEAELATIPKLTVHSMQRINTRRVPKNARNALTGIPISYNKPVLNFNGEYAAGRYYQNSAASVLETRRNPRTQQFLTDAYWFTPKRGGRRMRKYRV